MLSEIIHAARVVYLTVLIHDIGERSTILRYVDFRNSIVRMQAYKQLSKPFRIDLPPHLRILSILWEDTLNILKRFIRFMSNNRAVIVIDSQEIYWTCNNLRVPWLHLWDKVLCS